MLRLSIPSLGSEEERAVTEVLRSGYLVQGKKVAAFEGVVADYLGVKHAVAVNSGTSALHLALLALGLGPNDEVIVPDYTFPATINVVELAGARPIVVDIEPHTFNIDVEKVQRAITPRTKAVIPVHLFGQSADLSPLLKLAKKHRLHVIEDAACVLGAEYKGCKCGTLGDMGCFSFHPRKIITTGEGGMIVTSKKNLAQQLRVLRNHGMTYGEKGIDLVAAGFNYRMTEMSAAMGLVQMSKLARLIGIRQRIAREYTQALKGIPWIKIPVTGTGNSHVFQAYIIQVYPSINRNRLMDYLKSRGIEVNFGTYAIHRLSFYKNKYGLKVKDYPVAEQIFQTTVALPFFEQITKNQILKVANTLRVFGS
jgi:perosamine synthetase